jgi:hypothetical protein
LIWVGLADVLKFNQRNPHSPSFASPLSSWKILERDWSIGCI